MGSHPWMTVTNYVPDLEEALARAQHEVFERREFGSMVRFGRRHPSEKVNFLSIEDAREYFDADGTCSVLDVYGIGDSPEPGELGPFPTDMLEKVLSSATPSRKEAEQALDLLYEALERGAASYLICYEAGVPTEYLFFGMSFD